MDIPDDGVTSPVAKNQLTVTRFELARETHHGFGTSLNVTP